MAMKTARTGGLILLIWGMLLLGTATAAEEAVVLKGRLMIADIGPDDTITAVLLETEDGEYWIVADPAEQGLVEHLGADVRITGRATQNADGKRFLRITRLELHPGTADIDIDP